MHHFSISVLQVSLNEIKFEIIVHCQKRLHTKVTENKLFKIWYNRNRNRNTFVQTKLWKKNFYSYAFCISFFCYVWQQYCSIKYPNIWLSSYYTFRGLLKYKAILQNLYIINFSFCALFSHLTPILHTILYYMKMKIKW